MILLRLHIIHHRCHDQFQSRRSNCPSHQWDRESLEYRNRCPRAAEAQIANCCPPTLKLRWLKLSIGDLVVRSHAWRTKLSAAISRFRYGVIPIDIKIAAYILTNLIPDGVKKPRCHADYRVPRYAVYLRFLPCLESNSFKILFGILIIKWYNRIIKLWNIGHKGRHVLI